MNRSFRVVVAVVISALVCTGTVRADSFLSITVNGGPATTFASVGNSITTGTFVVGGVLFSNITIAANQPGSANTAFTTDSATAVTNNTGATANITIAFASNNFSLPATTMLQFNSSQSVTVSDFAGGPSISQAFFAYGDGANALVPGTGTLGPATGVTVDPTSQTNSGSATSGPATFSRSGNFGLNGSGSFSLAPGQVASFQDAINVAPVPEPSSVVLLGAGLIALAGRRRRA